MSEQDARRALGSFDLKGDVPLQRLSTLSGGQRSRVLLAQLAWQAPHMLLLDEVTNHLDMDSIEALIAALTAFQGGVVFVSHDQHFIKSVAKDLWLVNDGLVQPYSGTVEELVNYEE